MTGFGVGVEVRTDEPPFYYVSESKLMWQEDDGWDEGTELKKVGRGGGCQLIESFH